MTKKKAKGAGGKLSRSEIVQARLSPKLRFVAEILSRQQRRTLSSLIECLIEKEANNAEVTLDDKVMNNTKQLNMMKVLNDLWIHDEPKRLVVMGLFYPSLLSAHEEKIYRLVFNNLYFWQCYRWITYDKNNIEVENRWFPIKNDYGLIEKHLEEYWEILNSDSVTSDDLPARDVPGEILKDSTGEPKVFDVKISLDLSRLSHQEREVAIQEYFALPEG